MEIVDKFLQDKHQQKQVSIIAVFVAVFLLVILVLYLWLKPEQTCMDGKKNQNEAGVDCGGVCGNRCDMIVAQALSIQESGFVESGTVNKIDLYSRISNPNNIFGNKKFQYEFIIKDETGNIIATRQGTNYVLPAENKYIVENNIEISGIPSSVEFNIINQEWIEFTDYYEKPQLRIVNKQYNQITSGVGFSEVKGLLKNESPFNFSVIEINIILKDANGSIIALNSTEMNTVKSGENRDFKTVWFTRFPGEVLNVEVQPEVNVFESETFIKKYFVPSL